MTFVSKISLFSAMIVFCLSLLSSSCGDNSIDAANSIVFPDTGKVSFYNHVQPFVKLRCASAGCHSDYSMAAGRRMTDYNSYFETNNLGFVVPGNPDGSVLYQVMTGKNNHLEVMRIVLPTEKQKNGIYRWIKDGALMN